MNQNCSDFRARLSAFLSGAPNTHSEQSLAWNEHLLGCAECRQILENEQALDELLSHLPNPSLSHAHRQELLKRLTVDARLESLLTLGDLFPSAPIGLSDRIRAHVQRQAQEVMDGSPSSLDGQLAKIDHIQAPEGLAERVFNYCQAKADEAQGSPDGVLSPVGRSEMPAVSVPSSRAPQKRPGKRAGKPVLRHWFSTGLAAASLAAILWYLPGTDSPNQSNPPGTDGIGGSGTTVAQNGSGGSETEAPGFSGGMGDSELDSDADQELLAMLDTLELMDMVDELDAEEWDLLEDYDRYALNLLDMGLSGSTDGGASGEGKNNSSNSEGPR